MFIESVWTTHGLPQWTCNGDVIVVSGDLCRHDAGMSGTVNSTAPGTRRLDSASAFVLRCSHLPSDVCKTATSGAGTTTFFIDVELTE
jgi:hypothetical protein